MRRRDLQFYEGKGRFVFANIMLNIKVIVLDFDGVVLESTDIKTRAFQKLFANYTDHLKEIIKYHQDNGGISRYIKFRHIYENIIREPYNGETERRLAKEFEKLVFDRVIRCPLVDGAIGFLEKYYQQLPLYIVSGIPDKELREILDRRQMNKYFIKVYGASRSKEEWLKMIIEENDIDTKELLFVGDALSDYQAGIAVKVRFIGRIIGDRVSFPPENTFATIGNIRELSSIVETLLKQGEVVV